MQIVIDMSDEKYKQLRNEYYGENEVNHLLLMECAIDILNGTSLPKGHGRLIDTDAIEGHPRYDCEGFEVGKDFDWMDIEDAPTIIEADKDE